jgi:hypothetical protein
MALHDELLTTMVVYIGRLATAGQFHLLREIGLSSQQIEKVKALSLAEMNELSSLGSRFMDIKVDAASFECALVVLGRRLEDKRLTERLLRAGACYPVMKDLTGMETRDFVAQRQRLGLANSGNGRAAKPDAASQHRICRAWVASGAEPDTKLRLLDVHAATGVAIRAIWPVVNAWDRQGELPIEDGQYAIWRDLLKSASPSPSHSRSLALSPSPSPFTVEYPQ